MIKITITAIIFIAFIYYYFVFAFKKKFTGPYKFLVLISAFVFFGNYVVEIWQLPAYFTWHKEFLLFFAGVEGFKKNGLHNLFKNFPFFSILLLLLLLNIIISAFLNDTSLIKVLYAVRTYLYFPAFFLIFLSYMITDGDFSRKSIVFFDSLILIVLLQIPVAIIQYFLFERGDFVGGTFSYHASGIISIIGISYIPLLYFTGAFLKKASFFVYSLLMFFVLMISESKIAMYILPLFVLISEYFRHKKKIFIIAPTFCIIIICFFLILPWFDIINTRVGRYEPNHMRKFLQDPYAPISKRISRYDTSLNKIVVDSEKMGRKFRYRTIYNRISSIHIAYLMLKKDDLNIFFGLGPGESFLNSFYIGKLAYSGLFKTFVVTVLVELGLVGLALWALLFLLLVSTGFKALRCINFKTMDKKMIVIIYYLNILNVVSAFGMFYNLYFLGDAIGVYFWFTNILTYYFYISRRRQKKMYYL